MAIADPPPHVHVEPTDGKSQDGVLEVAAVIDYDEYEAARREPKWRSFYDEANSYRQRLVDSGRSI